MRISTVKRRLREIRKTARDGETAHGLEDTLFVDVLRAIASQDPGDPAHMLAAEALRSRDIEFGRWSA